MGEKRKSRACSCISRSKTNYTSLEATKSASSRKLTLDGGRISSLPGSIDDHAHTTAATTGPMVTEGGVAGGWPRLRGALASAACGDGGRCSAMTNAARLRMDPIKREDLTRRECGGAGTTGTPHPTPGCGTGTGRAGSPSPTPWCSATTGRAGFPRPMPLGGATSRRAGSPRPTPGCGTLTGRAGSPSPTP